jgi:hypothetical protein
MSKVWYVFVGLIFKSAICTVYFEYVDICKKNAEQANVIEDNGKIYCHVCHGKKATYSTGNTKKSSIHR